jgi:hypothetical protein
MFNQTANKDSEIICKDHKASKNPEAKDGINRAY